MRGWDGRPKASKGSPAQAPRWSGSRGGAPEHQQGETLNCLRLFHMANGMKGKEIKLITDTEKKRKSQASHSSFDE